MTRSNLLKQILTAPEKVMEHLDLVYVDDKKLPITRIRKDAGFLYRMREKPISDKKLLERIEGLVIPPAWENVRITHLQNGHLQAVGKDAKNRKQYRYHATWMRIRNQTKFYKMASFGKILPAIRAQVDKDLSQRGWPRTKVLALVIKLMEETHIRIGSAQYAKRNKSFGLSTLRKRHMNIHKNGLRFEFTGKKGIKHSVTLKNIKLIRLLNRCEEIPGWELFQYYDDNGVKQQIDSSLVNEYLQEISKAFFTAKDFRTWSASVIFFDALMELGLETDPKLANKNINEAYDAAAIALGNTRTVCREYYVHPLLVSAYEDGTIKKSFKHVESHADGELNFSPSEKAILKLISAYSPDITEEAGG